MSYETYRFIHLMGMVVLFVSLGGLIALAYSGKTGGLRKALVAIHGTSMLVMLVAGFGLLAKIGISHGDLPGWVIGKLVLWLVLGGIVVLIRKQPSKGVAWVGVVSLLGFVTVALGVFKPF